MAALSEILSREEFDDEFLRVCRPTQQLYDTIRALANAVSDGIDEYWASAESDKFKTEDEREFAKMLREKGWLS